MKLMKWLATSVALVAFGLSSATAADKAKQDEVLKSAQSTLADFYKADPKLKGQVEKAPGYATFTTFGISFLVGGAGGKGVVHDKATKKNTFMELAQASAGLQIGASDMRYLFIFDTPASMQQFIDKGWDASASASAGAGVEGKGSASASSGTFTGGKFYQLTKNGLQAGVAASGTKVWKDKDLN
ncbi:MAG TPA: YSC84-related protein [Burkholderiaceae bacterium]|nr:YSC84-related protein [Burkholderiaceae bacterium]